VIRLALRVRRADAERVLAELLELAPSGLEERELGDVVEFAVYGAPGELPALPDLRAAAAGAFVDVATSEVGDDWAERWREFHRPVEIGGRLLVRAPWHPPRADRLEVVVDPGQAFGTGGHPTTRLCLELLLELRPRGALVDLGCGSGVLAIAAAKLGFDPVAGVDHDPAALAAAAANAAANGVRVATLRHDLVRDGPAPGAPTVVANLVRGLLLRVADHGFAGAPPQALVASGLLEEEADEASAAFARRGLVEAARRAGSGWAALLLRGRPTGQTRASPSPSMRSLRTSSETVSSSLTVSRSRRARSLGTVRFSTTGSSACSVTSCSSSEISGPLVASSTLASVIGSRSTRTSSRWTGTVRCSCSVTTYLRSRARPVSRRCVPTSSSSSERVIASSSLPRPDTSRSASSSCPERSSPPSVSSVRSVDRSHSP